MNRVTPETRDRWTQELNDLLAKVDLEDVLNDLGYARDRGSSTRRHIVMKKGCDTIIIARMEGRPDRWFRNGTTGKLGNAADIYIEATGRNIGHALAYLRGLAGEGKRYIPRKVYDPPAARKSPAQLRAEWDAMSPYSGTYLQSRGLSDTVIHEFAPWIQVDYAGKVCFPHQVPNVGLMTVTGWERRGPGDRGIFSTGGSRTLCIMMPGSSHVPSRLVVTESAIDCMSYRQLNSPPEGTVYISSGGTMTESQADSIAALAGRHFVPVVDAMDNDENGKKYAAKLRERIPSRMLLVHRPESGVKDWNDELQRICKLVDNNDNAPAPVRLPGI